MIDREDFHLFVDTAGSMDGVFPDPSAACRIVGIQGPHGYVLVCVSSRYTAPTDDGDAVTQAVDAYDETEGSDVPWPGAGGRFYHVDVWNGADDNDHGKRKGVVRQDTDTGDWQWHPEPDMDADSVLDMDVTLLADRVCEGPFTYRPTEDERAALGWVGERYGVVQVLCDAYDEDANLLTIDPEDVRDALTADGLDRVPMLAEDTALQRIVWCIGPAE